MKSIKQLNKSEPYPQPSNLKFAGEVVPLKNPVALSEEVETWLKKLVDETRRTLEQLLAEYLERSGDNLADNLSHYPSQILCLAEAIAFTRNFPTELNYSIN